MLLPLVLLVDGHCNAHCNGYHVFSQRSGLLFPTILMTGVVDHDHAFWLTTGTTSDPVLRTATR